MTRDVPAGARGFRVSGTRYSDTGQHLSAAPICDLVSAIVSASFVMRFADDPRALVGRRAYLDEVRVARVVRRRVRQYQFDEAQDDGEMIADGVNRFGIQPRSASRTLHDRTL